MNKYEISDGVKDLCDQISHKRSVFYSKMNDCCLLGKGTEHVLNDAELDCLNFHGQECRSFHKFDLNGHLFSTEKDARALRTDNSIVELENGQYGVIANICCLHDNLEQEVVIFIRKLKILRNTFVRTRFVSVEHIKVVEFGRLSACSPAEIKKPAMLIPFNDQNLICEIPFGCMED